MRKKRILKKFLKFTCLTLSLVTIFYVLSFVIISPIGTSRLINRGEMKDEYNRTYMFSLKSSNDEIIPNIDIFISEDQNTLLSEMNQKVDLYINTENFQWDKLYKFNSLIIKTPYDKRYFKTNLSDYSDYDFTNNQVKEKSQLLKLILNEYKNKNNFYSFDILKSDKTIINNLENKIELKYNLKEIENPQNIINKIYENVLDSKKFKSFFLEDNFIQSNIEIKNNTKNIIDIIDNIIKNLEVNSLNVNYSLNLEYTNNISLVFKGVYKFEGQEVNVEIELSEFISNLPDNFSPEENFKSFNVTPITK